MSKAHTLEDSRPVGDALAAAGIPMARLGASRSARLSPAEREFYFWILRRFSREGPPSAEAIRAEAARLRLDLEQTRKQFAAEDLVHFDAEGELTVAYPFSARPRGHRVLIDGERSVEAMCAIDALGIAPMLDLPIEITSRDPVSGGKSGCGSIRPRAPGGSPRRRSCLQEAPAATAPASAAAVTYSTFSSRSRTRSATCATTIRSAACRSQSRRRASSAAPSSATSSRGLMPTPIDRDEVQRLVEEEDGQVVEVLPPGEYEDEHLPGAINIPLKTLDAETSRRLERERPVIVYCHDYQ